MPLTILVPRGAEEQAVRRALPGATIVAFAAGAASRVLPDAIGEDAFVVVLGLCGSLVGLRVGDIVAYERVVDLNDDVTLDANALAAVSRALPAAQPVVACTTDQVVTRASERAAVAARTGAAVVDMEGTHAAHALRERGVRFAMVRVVSDDPRFDLPPIEQVLASNGAIRPLALARAFVLRPLAFVRFVRDVRSSLRVLGAVATQLERDATSA